MRKTLLKRVHRVVVKIGTAALSNAAGGLDEDRVAQFAGQVEALRRRGLEVVVVTSGAIGAGRDVLRLAERPRRLAELQACAAIGQGRLMAVYDRCFARWGYSAAQVLLTREDIDDRRRYLNAANTIRAILRYGGVPLINENDTISVEEIAFGDNDGLAALVTHLVRADLLILLTVVDGLYENADGAAADRRVVSVVEEVTDAVAGLAAGTTSRGGTGGMRSKIAAARTATAGGAAVIVANACAPRILERLFDGEPLGTLFLPADTALRSRKRWLRFGSRPRGALIVDAGARRALVENGKSLLPSGIREVEGDFAREDLVAIRDEHGQEIGRGIAAYSADELRRIRGQRTTEIRRLLGEAPFKVAVHRDNLALSD